MPISTVKPKIRLTMLCLSGFELYSLWVPLKIIIYHHQLYSRRPLLYKLFLNVLQISISMF